MSRFLFSRPRVALNLAILPFLFAKHVALSAVEAAREAFADLREDIAPAVRYVLTGDTAKGSVGAAVAVRRDAVLTATGSGISAVKGFAVNRLLAILFLLITPFVALYVVGVTVVDGFRYFRPFEGFGEAVVGFLRSIVDGLDPVARV